MIKLFGLAGGENYHSRSAFKPALKDGFRVNGGKVISIYNNQKFDFEGDFSSEEETEEAYLHIKGSPLSSKIHEVNIIQNKLDLEKKKLESDNLLNIYIPLGKAVKSKGDRVLALESADSIDKNFLWLKKHEDKPFAFYFDGEKVQMTGYLLYSGEGRKVKKSDSFQSPPETEIEKTPKKFLCLEIDITINEYEDTFTLDKYQITNKEEGSVKCEKQSLKYTSEEMYQYGLALAEYEAESDEEDEEQDPPPDPSLFNDGTSFALVYPLGYIQKGNFIHGREPKNVNVRLQDVYEKKFIGTYEQEQTESAIEGEPPPPPCEQPNYEFTRISFIAF